MYLISALLPAASTQAQDVVDYYGVKLSVARFSSAGPRLRKVELGGDAFLVDEALAGQRTVLRLLSSPELAEAIEPDVVRQVLQAAAERNDSEVLQVLMPVVIGHPEWIIFDRDEIWSAVARSESARMAMQQAILQQPHQDARATRACAVMAALLSYPRTPPVEQWALVNGAGCIRQRMGSVFERLGGEGFDYAQADAYLGQQDALWLAQGSEQGGHIARLREVLRLLHEATRNGDDARFVRALNDLAETGRDCGVTVEAALLSGLLESFVVLAARQQRYASVIRCATHVDFERRTPALHGALVQALTGITVPDADPLLTSAMVERLGLFARKDEELARSLDLLLQRIALQRLADHRLGDARELITRGIASGPSGASAWADLAARLVKLQLRHGEVAAARATLEQMGLRQPWWLRLRVSIASYGLMPHLLFLVLCVAGCGWCGWRRLRPQRGSRDQARPVNASEPPGFKEYCELLELFSLTPGVGAIEIKNAYRAAVKEIHPDTQGRTQSGDATEFIRLTTAYERLVALHKVMEGSGARKAPV